MIVFLAAFSASPLLAGNVTLLKAETYTSAHWGFSAELDQSVTYIEYAVACEVNGVTYWDNNYGKNYSITITH